MTDELTGGVVEDRRADGRPIVDEWLPVDGAGSWPALAGDRADAGAIAYRTTFEDPRSDGTDRALLSLRGIGGRATIWVNGTNLGEREQYVAPALVTIDAALDGRSENELLVVCEPPASSASVDVRPDSSTPEGIPSRLAVPGGRLRIDVESRPRTFLRRLEGRPRLDAAANGHPADTLEGGGATVEVSIDVDAGAAIDDAITLSLRPEGAGGGATMERVSVTTAGAERTTVSRTLEVRDPSLWWPRGYGPQHRYTLRATLGEDTVDRTLGFRRIERDADGFVVNGTRVRARGFARLPGGEPRADVRRAREANATFVRARAHAPSSAFYTACDEAGLLVWQDFPATDDLGAERGRELAGDLARTYGPHPSLTMCSLREHPTDPFAEPLGSGVLAKLAFRYRAWRTAADHGSTPAIAEALPADLPVVPVVGPPGTDPDAARLAPGWQYLESDDLAWLLEAYPSLGEIVSAVGVGSVTADAEPSDVPGLDAALLDRRSDDESSRSSQATAVKTIAETLRRRRCGVFVAATLRDPSPGGGMGVVTADGEPLPAYPAIADSLEPLQAVLDGPPTTGSVGITLCNDTREALEATVTWQAGDAAGETTVDVDPLSTADAGVADVPPEASRVVLAVTAGDRSARNRYPL
ncbi:glycoside hydrolase family 2 [Halopiger djelfimassiliensis]|uniref:glycoside hydrolase family 2 n=1 Tax=Halopiger djelfimassiliensis TaxID=1293047 RepID=UPI0006778DA8|nr:glycoside hydrolase family 2 [Halopiger djelfimassiliensis]